MEMTQKAAASPPQKSKSRYSQGSTYQRNRKDTKFDTGAVATELKSKVSKYVMDEDHVPKRWRYIDGKPAIDYARHIRDLCVMANDIKLDSPDKDNRIAMEYEALRYCHVLQLQLLDIIEDCSGATHENMREVTDLLNKLFGKIRNWIEANEAAASSNETDAIGDEPPKGDIS